MAADEKFQKVQRELNRNVAKNLSKAFSAIGVLVEWFNRHWRTLGKSEGS